MKRSSSKSLTEQVKSGVDKPRRVETPEVDARTANKVSSGSTLLDLAISGSACRYGGIPVGIMCEVFGPAGSGKTVLLCEVAGGLQRGGGQVMFRDPEGRLNKQFARQFDLNMDKVQYDMPHTVKQVFEPIREWQPEPENAKHGVFTDSLAALSTETELEEGDKRGQLRAKQFSEECRKTCRTLAQKGYLMMCSNQVRQNSDPSPYSPKHYSPGGEAIGFYSSLRLKTSSPQRIKKEKKYKGKKQNKVIGVNATFEVFKNSIAEPYHTAPLYIVFDYGIDDIRANLQWLKTNTGASSYQVNSTSVGQGIDEAVRTVEDEELENELIENVVDTWHEIAEQFRMKRKKKRRS